MLVLPELSVLGSDVEPDADPEPDIEPELEPDAEPSTSNWANSPWSSLPSLFASSVSHFFVRSLFEAASFLLIEPSLSLSIESNFPPPAAEELGLAGVAGVAGVAGCAPCEG